MNRNAERLSFEKFHVENLERAQRYALRLTRNADDAADLVQEAFCRAFKGFDRWEEEKPHDAWLMQIIKNTFLDQLRAKKRRPESISFSAFPAIEMSIDTADTALNPEERFLFEELSEPIEQALSRLTPEQRVIIYKLVRGVSYKNLAISLGCRLETVKTRVNRARIALKQHLRQLDPSYENYSKGASA